MKLFTRSILGLSFACLVPAAAAAQADSAATPAAEAPCVAVMPAVVSGIQGNAADAAAAARDALVSFLSGPALRPVALDARVRLQAVEEARQKNCTQLITLTLTKKRGGRSSVGRVVGRAAGSAAYHLPGGGSVGTAVARGLGIGTVHALSDMAATTRAKDEMQLEWTLGSIDGGAPSKKAEKIKATADGEDLLTPLVQRSADAIVELLLKK
jgi:hypothetical protein